MGDDSSNRCHTLSLSLLGHEPSQGTRQHDVFPTILSITVNGTASTIPITPQHRPQNARATSTTNGLRSTA